MKSSSASLIFQLESLLARCEGAYSPRTLSSYRQDLKCFIAWCEREQQGCLPATPQAVAAFTEEQIAAYRLSTIRRRISAINFAHRMSDLPDPTRHSSVRLALRRALRAKVRRPEQVLGLTSVLLKKIVAASPHTLAGLRDAALFSVGYDTLCRSYELVLICVGHIEFHSDGSASVLIPRSKADLAGDGRIAYLSPATVNLVEQWLEQAGIGDGPLFRGLHLGRVSERPLDTSTIRRITKRAARLAGIEEEIVQGLSGHSMRVGAAQDMMAAGFDLISIMQAGGWKTPAVAVRYVENASARGLHERRWGLLQKSA